MQKSKYRREIKIIYGFSLDVVVIAIREVGICDYMAHIVSIEITV
jgi:hypothetical protein